MNLNFNTNYAYFSKIFLEQITSNPQFKIDFGAFAPEIYADIESYSKNPNCSCRGKIERFVNDNKNKCFDFIKNFIEKNNLTIDVFAIQAKYQTVQYSGKVVQLKKADWASFVEALSKEKATFRMFSILPIDNETIELYFL